MNRTTPRATRMGTVLVVSFSLAVLALAGFATPNARSGRTDFLSYYAGAKLVRTPNLYSAPHVHEIERRYGDPGELRAFTRLPFQALLLWPLGRLPYFTAHWVWQALMLLAVAGFVWLWSPRAVFVPLCCLYFPVWISLNSGQDIPLILLALAVSVALLRRGRPEAAGLVFTLCAIKFHLFLLLPLLVVARRLWRFAGGFAAGAAVQAAVSFWAAGWDWPYRYLELLKLNESSEASVSRMLNLNGLLHGLPHTWIWLLAASALVVYGSWRAMRRTTLEAGVGVMLAGGLLVGMHGYMVDAVLLLPAFIALGDRAGLGKIYVLAGLMGCSVVSLATASTAPLAQLALVALFAWLVCFAPLPEETSAA